ncbi:MAG: hypothetical protein AMXMBFR82_18880 [Candidatus Hydrogenedentota bacterium]
MKHTSGKIARILCALMALMVIAGGIVTAASAEVDFESQIAPILEERCYACHSSDKRKGGLSLESLADAQLGGDSGPAVQPGDTAASELIRRITSDDEAERMPPKGDPLPEETISLLRTWIEEGVSWGDTESAAQEPLEGSDHWAFQKPAQPALPETSGTDWAQNPIDAFTLAAMQAQGLAPSPEADRYTLIRRLSLDLTGLPPTPEEVESFVNDTGSDAYERLVDRLLASPHFGERMAIRWLDAARYADTNGFEKDRPRSIWPYRDWVIDAFNENMPYDRFVVEQIAGDLLPNATEDQRVATGFLRNSMINEEGGIDVEEYRYEAMVDRTNTVGTVFLGLTMACAQCHTHKYDPVTQREYFQFYAFLNNTDDVDMELHDAAVAKKREAIEAEIAALIADLPNQFPVDDRVHEERVLMPAVLHAESGATLEADEDGFVLAGGEPAERDTYTLAFDLGADPVDALQIELATADSLPQKGPGRADNGNLVLSEVQAFLKPQDGEAIPIKLPRAEATRSQDKYPAEHAVDGNEKTGWALGAAGEGATLTLWLAEPLHATEPSQLELRLVQNHGAKHTLGRFRISAVRDYLPESDLPDDERRAQHLARKMQAWEDEVAAKSAEWSVAEPVEYVSANHATFERLDDDSLLLKGDIPNTDTYEVQYRTDLNNITAIRIEVLPHPSLPNGGPGRGVIMSAGGDFLLSEIAAEAAPWLDPQAVESIALQNPTEDFAAPNRTAAMALDGKLDTGWSIKDGEGKPHAAVFEFAAPVGYDDGTLLKLKLDQFYVHQHTLGRFRVSVTNDPLPVQASGVPANIEAILMTPGEQRNDAQRVALTKYYLSIAPELHGEHEKIDALRASMPNFPRTMVLEEREDPRVTRIHHRGEFLSPREEVTPAAPAVLHELEPGAPKNRLAFARWLVSEENPLTARVAVNRLWQMLFGRGIVNTPEDFGLRGDTPSHPELLDWMAVEFMRRGWDTKDLVRMIVTSATYRQTSRTTPKLIAADPDNEWLARGARFRVDAEIVRDIALASSELLNPAIGGPSVKPPLPDGALSLVYPGDPWNVAEGADRYRRGLYTYWKRTLPYPTAMVFDAAARDTACVRRVESNTPLQALTMLNDTELMAAAKALAERVLDEAPPNTNARIAHAFMLVVSRPPDEQELAWVDSFYTRQRFRLQLGGANPEAIFAAEQETDSRIELAAWTLVCRAILNTDEAITRG